VDFLPLIHTLPFYHFYTYIWIGILKDIHGPYQHLFINQSSFIRHARTSFIPNFLIQVFTSSKLLLKSRLSKTFWSTAVTMLPFKNDTTRLYPRLMKAGALVADLPPFNPSDQITLAILHYSLPGFQAGVHPLFNEL